MGLGTWGHVDVKYRDAGDVTVYCLVQGKCEIYRMCHYTTGSSTIITIFYFV